MTQIEAISSSLDDAAEIIGRQRLEISELREALKNCLPLLEDAGEHVGYGFARPSNPHDFSPDHECCTDDEVAAHKAACEAYDRGEYDPSATPGSFSGPNFHLLRAPWGIGSYTMRDEHVGAVIDAARAALAKPTTGAAL